MQYATQETLSSWRNHKEEVTSCQLLTSKSATRDWVLTSESLDFLIYDLLTMKLGKHYASPSSSHHIGPGESYAYLAGLLGSNMSNMKIFKKPTSLPSALSSV